MRGRRKTGVIAEESQRATLVLAVRNERVIDADRLLRPCLSRLFCWAGPYRRDRHVGLPTTLSTPRRFRLPVATIIAATPDRHPDQLQTSSRITGHSGNGPACRQGSARTRRRWRQTEGRFERKLGRPSAFLDLPGAHAIVYIAICHFRAGRVIVASCRCRPTRGPSRKRFRSRRVCPDSPLEESLERTRL